MQFVGVFAAGCLAITVYAAALEPTRQPTRRAALMAVAFALSGIAAFSMSNGLISAVVLVVLTVLARAPLRQVLVAAGVLATLIAAFASGYEMLGGDTLRAGWLDHPERIPLFARRLPRNVFDGNMPAAVALGGCGPRRDGADPRRVRGRPRHRPDAPRAPRHRAFHGWLRPC